MIDNEGQPITVGLAGPENVALVADGLMLQFSRRTAVELARELFKAGTGTKPSQLFGDPEEPMQPLTPEQEAAVNAEMSSPSPFEPDAATRARAIECYNARINGTPHTWQITVLNAARDINCDGSTTPSMLDALVSYGVLAMVRPRDGMLADADEIRAQIAYDLATEREIALNDKKAQADDD